MYSFADSRNLGQFICQYHPGKSLTDDELKDYCRDKNAHFKIPRYVRFVEEYPMTVTGKIQKFFMRDLMKEELAAEQPLLSAPAYRPPLGRQLYDYCNCLYARQRVADARRDRSTPTGHRGKLGR